MKMNKLKTLLGLTASAKKHKSKMLSRLVLSWTSMIVVVLAVIMFILSFTGVFSQAEDRLGGEINSNTQLLHEKIDDHFDSLMANVIAFSSDCTKALSKTLATNDISYLNDNHEQLKRTQSALFNHVNTWLRVSDCSGAFVILNATTNTHKHGAETSRSCIYLRYDNLSATKNPNNEITCFRGMQHLTSDFNITLHNRWEMEFDLEKIEYLKLAINQVPSGSLSKACRWSNKISLTNTWEDIFIVTVPMLDNHGKVAGLCGFEVSELYFRLYYPAIKSEFGNTFTLIAPYNSSKNSLETKSGFHGGLEGSLNQLGDYFTVEKGKYFDTYISDQGTYLGKQEELTNIVTFNHYPIMITTLLPKESFASKAKSERSLWIIISFSIFLVALIVAIVLSRLFISPITKSLDAIKDGTISQNEKNPYVEIEELYTFLNEKEMKHQTTIQSLEQEKNQKNEEISTAQTKIDRLAYLRNKEINPDDFEAFLQGLKLLTPTEKEIYNLYIKGKSSKEIMEIKNITENTLKYHNKNIYAKLSVSSRKTMLQFATLIEEQKHNN